MKNIFRFLKVYRPNALWAVSGILLSLVTNLANIALMALAGWFIASMGIAGAAGVTMNYFTPAAGIRALAITRTLGRYAERLVTHDATLRMTTAFRPWIYAHIEPLAPEGLAAYHSSELFGRLRSDVDVLERFYLGAVAPICVGIAGVFIMSAALFFIAPALALAGLAFLLLAGACIPLALHKVSCPRYAGITRDLSLFRRGATEFIQGMGELTVYDSVRQRRQALERQSENIMRQQLALARAQAWAQGATALLVGASAVAALAIGILLLESGRLNPAMLAALPLVAIACFDLVLPLPAALQNLQSAEEAAARIFEIVDKAAALKTGSRQTAATPDFELKFSNVTFGYGEGPLFKNRSFTLKGGGVISLEGASGSGKSTVAALLTGLCTLATGDITVNGVSIRACDPDDWRRQFAVAEQRPYIFLGTFRSNLLLARPEATADELDRACALAGLSDEIQAMPQGYDTYLGEGGAKLSGGQIRRLAIARAVLKDAPCLILDEPEEGLDRKQARAILQAVLEHAASRKKAVLLISHDKTGQNFSRHTRFDLGEMASRRS